MKTNLSCIEQKNLENLSSSELQDFKKEVALAMTNCEETEKLKLKKILYYAISYIGGLGIGFCIARNILGFIYNGSPRNLVETILIIAAILVPITIVSVLFSKAKKDVEKIKMVCKDKLEDINRQITLNAYKENIKKESENVEKENSQNA